MEPVYVVLAAVFFIGFALIFFGKKKDEQLLQNAPTEDQGIVKQPALDEVPEMTLKQLSEFNGKKNSKVYLACKGIVFNVTGSEFYVGDGGYGAFAAKDCSVNLAKMSFEEGDYNMYGKVELTMSEKDILDQWYEKYYSKYPIVARISTTESKKDH